MAITFKCLCGREITVKDEHAGRRGKCPGCGKAVVVPIPDEPEPVVIEEPAVEEPAPETVAAPAGETKACGHCRKPIARNAVFCVHCGTDLRTGKKHTSDNTGMEGDYDFIKNAPDMVTKPMDAVGIIIEAPATAANFQKALILFAIGAAIFTYTLTQTAPPEGILPTWWMFLLTAVLAVVVTVAWGIVAGVTGATAGQTGIGFANVLMAVIAARAVIGIAMVIPLILVLTLPGTPGIAAWTGMFLRVLAGGGLMYVIIYRAYDCGQGPAIVAAATSVAVEAILFWLGGMAFGQLILGKSLSLI